MKILVTGATGFIGVSLCKALISLPDVSIVGSGRSSMDLAATNFVFSKVAAIPTAVEWRNLLEGVDVVIHLAARAHILSELSSDPLAEFRKVNVEGTLSLAEQAINAGVKRFIFLSSIGVNGNFTSGQAFSESSAPAPHAIYAISKWEAEQGLEELCTYKSMELVIIRPPLVYGANAPGNFKRLLKLVSSGIPLPLAGIKNKRTMVALENLVDFVKTCVTHPLAANELFLVSDEQSVSTPQIIKALASGMKSRASLFPVPDLLLHGGAKMTGRLSVYQQLCGSLEIDSSKSRTLLSWVPPLQVKDALKNAGGDFKKNQTP
ncbi:NAD-dependent epimerase/dehydratase family protein [Pseudomonas sp. 7P_10.2_Bac1]|uniref:NAD-dependent epimerase/dehydratase family protein n=1 Tax=Pseudomonas sp. 7P_10.2_Bac1 TaxID=2971614 RepID=UPI0021C941B5|nr:NAD-dependent epimerase/dehydratase family protein [Pseudomonas sp. 7P_10.2_Bac1]MCU1728750.1 NAD-dependent epimerase/dehydratase family protein [Pseudomonas sp. 7P_10.2_Bac1]